MTATMETILHLLQGFIWGITAAAQVITMVIAIKILNELQRKDR